jgi:hypothetical protein
MTDNSFAAFTRRQRRLQKEYQRITLAEARAKRLSHHFRKATKVMAVGHSPRRTREG